MARSFASLNFSPVETARSLGLPVGTAVVEQLLNGSFLGPILRRLIKSDKIKLRPLGVILDG